jgi:hypothetical protein
LVIANPKGWKELPGGLRNALLTGGPFADRIVGFRFRGRSASGDDGSAQTLLSAYDPGAQPPL